MTEQLTDAMAPMESQPVSEVSANAVAPSRVYTDDDVNRIAGKKKQEGYEKGYEKGMQAARESQAPQSLASPPSSFSSSENVVTEDAINKAIDARFQHQEQLRKEEWRQLKAHEVAQKYFSSLQAARSKYDATDFDNTVGRINYNSPVMSSLVELAVDKANLDNVGDVIYHLKKNPDDMHKMLNLIQHEPDSAKNALLSISNRLKKNETAKDFITPSDPLSQPRPSNLGMDSGELSIEDFKNLFKA